MLAPVPPCAGEYRFVRGDFVGNHAADPDLWGFCGAEDTQLNQVSRPSGTPGQCQQHSVPGRPGRGASFSVGAGSCRVIIGTRTTGTCAARYLPGMTGICTSNNPVTALLYRPRSAHHQSR